MFIQKHVRLNKFQFELKNQNAKSREKRNKKWDLYVYVMYTKCVECAVTF